MDKEALHVAFAKVVDTSFAFTMAFNEHGADSAEACAANNAYVEAMAAYRKEAELPFSTSTRWEILCRQSPDAAECRLYDV
jgi:hypothetical protein